MEQGFYQSIKQAPCCLPLAMLLIQIGLDASNENLYKKWEETYVKAWSNPCNMLKMCLGPDHSSLPEKRWLSQILVADMWGRKRLSSTIRDGDMWVKPQILVFQQSHRICIYLQTSQDLQNHISKDCVLYKTSLNHGLHQHNFMNL